jgi:hypothetical protein
VRWWRRRLWGRGSRRQCVRMSGHKSYFNHVYAVVFCSQIEHNPRMLSLDRNARRVGTYVLICTIFQHLVRIAALHLIWIVPTRQYDPLYAQEGHGGQWRNGRWRGSRRYCDKTNKTSRICVRNRDSNIEVINGGLESTGLERKGLETPNLVPYAHKFA